MKKQRVTIKDIARIANVTPTTVSMALNGQPRVGAETRERILEIAQRLGYQPDFIARSLRGKRTYTIGMMIKNIADPFYPELACGIGQAAQERGYDVILCNVGENQQDKAKTIHLLRARGVDGIISTVTLDQDGYLQTIVGESMPFVAVVRTLRTSPFADRIDSVSVDNYSGGYRAIEHLYRLGHDRIGIVAGTLEASTGADRTLGAEQALRDHGLETAPERILDCRFSRDKAGEGALRFLSLDHPPTAIFAEDDNMALGVREALLARGVRIPQDVGLIGFDDIDVAGLTGVDLTTINQKIYEMGALGVSVLLDKVEGLGPPRVQKIVLESKLVIRKTCGYPQRGYVRALPEEPLSRPM
jgi:LacI family transcriptional regulator